MRHLFTGWRGRLSLARLLPLVFLLTALPMGLGAALLTPIGLVSDEPEHIFRADGLLLGQIMGIKPHGQPGAGVMVNMTIFEVAVSELTPCLYGHKLPPKIRQAADGIFWLKMRAFCATQMVSYVPAFYLPAAAGLGLGQAIGLTPLHTAFFARIVMLLVFLGLGTAALACARQGQALLFAILTLPTTISLAASFNQDGLLIASGALAAALLTRATPGPRNAAWLGALALLELITCSKLPYAPLLLACLPPLGQKYAPARALLLALAMLPPLLWLAYLTHGHDGIWPRAPYHPGPLWPGDRQIWLTTVPLRDSLLVLACHPMQILLLPLTSLGRDWLQTCRQALYMIGWNDTPIWGWECPALAASLLTACLGSALGRPPAAWRGRDQILLTLAIIATFMAVSLSSYISFNDIGATSILCVFGRYYLPYLPFLLFLLPRPGRLLPQRAAKLPAASFALPAIAMAILNTIALPAAIYHIYQMPGP